MPRSIFTNSSSSQTTSGNSSSTRSTTRPTSTTTTQQKYGSVKYNRIAASVGKEDVHETYSNPVMPVSAPFVVEVDDVEENLDPNPTDRTSPRSPPAAVDGGGKLRNGSAPDGLLNSNYAGTNNFMATLEVSSANVPPTTRQKHLSLLPPSLHISFDVEPENSRSQQFALSMPLSQSSDNVRHYHQRYGSVSSTGGGNGGQTTPRQAAVYRQNQRRILQQSEIASISAGYMRANGAVQQFRRILAAPEKNPTLLSKVLNKQHSKDKDKDNIGSKDKEESSTTTLMTLNRNHNCSTNQGGGFHHGSLDDARFTSMNASIGGDQGGDYSKVPIMTSISNGGNSNNMCPGATATAEATLDAFKLPVCRVGQRHRLFDQRRKACDYSCIFAILGIVLMIMENELTAGGVYTKSSPYSYGLKSLIVLSTLVLVMLIFAYHALELQLSMVDLGCYDWRILINAKRTVQISLEILACIICPVPGDYQFTWRTVHHDGKTITAALVPVDVLLSIPMFLRLYLLCRLMLLHSKLFTDAPSRSIGAMNRVNFTARFVLKTLMTMSPGTVLLIFTASFWLTAAWIMLLCERHHGFSYYTPPGMNAVQDPNRTVMHYEAIKHQNYLNSLWLVAITSLTIGYGDIVPNTYCGRAVSVICGIMGAGTSSLVVAVVAKKLELSRAEKHVHNFMMDSCLTKKLKNAAANVLRETWLIYKNRKLADKVDASKIRYHQRKFLIAIYQMRRVKRGQRKLNENSTTVADMAKTTSMMYEMIADMRTWQQEMEEKVVGMDQRCANVEAYMRQLQISIRVLPELVARKLHPSSSAASAMAFKPNSSSQATSYCDSQLPSAAQSINRSTDAHNGSGYSTPE